MNSIETITELKVGEIFDSNGKKEIITEVVYEDKKLERFRTARRDGEAIVESDYCVDEAGKTRQLFSGIYFGKKTPPFNASERYFKLDKFLREREK
ncbi:MAG: hypothetical protein AABW93_03510 [Nanoarchaeota archaeon]